MKPEDFTSIKDGLESDLAKATGVLDWSSGMGWCKGSFADGDFSIFSTSPLLSTERPENPDLAKPWGIPLESVEEILAKKLRLRMYGNGEFLARDFYDIITANEENPQALSRALSILGNDKREDIVEELHYWRRRSLAGRSVEEVHHPEWLPDLVSRTSDIIKSGPSLVPEPDPPPPSPSFDPF